VSDKSLYSLKRRSIDEQPAPKVREFRVNAEYQGISFAEVQFTAKDMNTFKQNLLKKLNLKLGNSFLLFYVEDMEEWLEVLELEALLTTDIKTKIVLKDK